MATSLWINAVIVMRIHCNVLQIYSIFLSACDKGQMIFGQFHTKTCFRAYADSEALISLRSCAGWSGPWLSANRVLGHYRMYQWEANACISLWACGVWIWICAFCAYSKTRFCLMRPIFKAVLSWNIYRLAIYCLLILLKHFKHRYYT